MERHHAVTEYADELRVLLWNRSQQQGGYFLDIWGVFEVGSDLDRRCGNSIEIEEHDGVRTISCEMYQCKVFPEFYSENSPGTAIWLLLPWQG